MNEAQMSEATHLHRHHLKISQVFFGLLLDSGSQYFVYGQYSNVQAFGHLMIDILWTSGYRNVQMSGSLPGSKFQFCAPPPFEVVLPLH